MKVEVDQSGRIEFTREDTVLAYANERIAFTVFISAKVKRQCIEELRLRGLSGPTLSIRLFVAGLFYLLKDELRHINQVIIDEEYSGKERDIKGHLLNLFGRAGYEVDSEVIQFGNIGKHSPAHKVALGTLRKELKPNMILKLKDILMQF